MVVPCSRTISDDAGVVLVVGGERDGIPEQSLEQSDEIIRIPMSGFVPSFNLQAPLSYVAIVAQRQRS